MGAWSLLERSPLRQDETWPLPADQAALLRAIRCGARDQAWTDEAGESDNLPMNCLSWYEAFAFCIWDGGRLPTETLRPRSLITSAIPDHARVAQSRRSSSKKMPAG